MNYPTPVQAMTVTNYDMFTDEGNYMVGRIVEAGQRLKALIIHSKSEEDTNEEVWAWTQHELRKLATADEFSEAIDTAVRERVYDKLIGE